MSLKDKGSAWKLVYAAFVAVENAPEDYLGWEEDEEGNDYEGISFWNADDLRMSLRDIELDEIDFQRIRFSQALGYFIREYENGEFTYPFTYEAYLKNENVIDTIEGFGLNVEQFWYAVLFIHWLTQIRCVNVIKRKGFAGEQMRKLSEYLKNVDSITIVAEGKNKLIINDSWVIRDIRESMNKKIAEYQEMGFDIDGTYGFNFASKGDHWESSSVQMWFAATRYLKLFENLDLPTIRAKDSEVKYKKRMVAGERISLGGGNKTVSYNKMLLISRLMHFTKMTRTENYLFSDEPLKGIVKQYKSLKINAHNPKYLF